MRVDIFGQSYDLAQTRDLNRALCLFRDRYDEISPALAYQILRANQAARIARGEKPWAPPPRVPLPSVTSYAIRSIKEELLSKRAAAVALLVLAGYGAFILAVVQAVNPLTLAVGFISIVALSGSIYLWNQNRFNAL